MLKKALIGSILLFLLLFLAGNASSEVKPIYAGWTVGDSWDDGSGTSYGTILRSTDSGETWTAIGLGAVVVLIALAVWQFGVSPKNEAEKANPQIMAYPLLDKPSIAVLLFKNLSGDAGQEFLTAALPKVSLRGSRGAPVYL